MTEEISYYDDELTELCGELRQKIDGLPRLSGEARAEVRGARPRARACASPRSAHALTYARVHPRARARADPPRHRKQRIAQLGVRMQRARQVLHSFKVEMRELSKEDAFLYDQVRA